MKLDNKSSAHQPPQYRPQLLTIEDLEEFKNNLLKELRTLLKELSGQPGRKWLKSFEVKKLLGISPGTLQNLRINGTLPFTKIGGVILYDYEDIQSMLNKHKK
jgi:hypothetical protein